VTFKEAEELIRNPKNTGFADLIKVATMFFGPPRIRGSHHVFSVPWPGEPYVNLQADGKSAKTYQVRQVQKAIKKLHEIESQIRLEKKDEKADKESSKKTKR
jgi:hypothetical protein